MSDFINFYMDDSGTRHPDHDPGKRAKHGFDWFALGGVLVKRQMSPRLWSFMTTFAEIGG